jgi:hypothetical protein
LDIEEKARAKDFVTKCLREVLMPMCCKREILKISTMQTRRKTSNSSNKGYD